MSPLYPSQVPANWQSVFSQYIADLTAEIQAIETWADNKADSSNTYDFTSTINALNTAKTTYMNTLATLLV